MRRGFIVLLALLLDPLSLCADNGREIERQLETSLVGKLAMVKPVTNTSTAAWKIPRALADRLDPNFPTYVRVEDLKVKKDKLILRAQELFYYKDTDGSVGEAEGASYSLEMRFPAAIPSEDELRTAIGAVLVPDTSTPLELVQSSPPPNSRRWRRWKQPAPEPSIEVTPGVFTIGSDITPPECDDCPFPEYGQELRARRVAGTVGMWVVVTERGTVASVQVAETTERSLVSPSVSAVYRWRMKPAVRNGKPISVMIWAEASFHIY